MVAEQGGDRGGDGRQGGRLDRQDHQILGSEVGRVRAHREGMALGGAVVMEHQTVTGEGGERDATREQET